MADKRLIAKDDEDFEILDLASRGWLQKMFGDLTKASVAKQFCVGGASGWVAGYLTCKVGKAAAMAIGGSLLVMQVASHQGLISINWGKLEKKVNKVKRTVKSDADKILPRIVDEVVNFAGDNACLAGGFAGGFFIGVAC